MNWKCWWYFDFSKKNEELTDGSYGQPDEYELEEEGGNGGEDNGDGRDDGDKGKTTSPLPVV